MPEQDTIPELEKSIEEMARLIRESAGDALTDFHGIEGMVAGLTKVLRSKILAFVQEDIEFIFSGMRMFDGIPDDKVDDYLKIRVSGDENSRIAAVIVEATPVRHILAILFGGQQASVADFAEGELTPSEASLFLLIADELVSGLAEAIDIITSHGVPGAPTISNKKEFRQFCEGHELVALEFSAGFEDDLTLFEFIVPLEFFDILKLATAPAPAEEKELTEEELWAAMLTDQVDSVKIPMGVELAAMDLSLSKLCELQIGETLTVNPTKGGLRILDELGATAFTAALEIDGNRFGLRVTSSLENEEA